MGNEDIYIGSLLAKCEAETLHWLTAFCCHNSTTPQDCRMVEKTTVHTVVFMFFFSITPPGFCHGGTILTLVAKVVILNPSQVNCSPLKHCLVGVCFKAGILC